MLSKFLNILGTSMIRIGTSITGGKDKSSEENQRRDAGTESSLYEALMAHVIHQDQLTWSIYQLLIALQGGVLVSGYALRDRWLSWAILFAGAIITIRLLALAEKNQLDRDVNREVMDLLAERILPNEIKKQLKDKGFTRPYVRVSSGRP